jgi:hypothetical protein
MQSAYRTDVLAARLLPRAACVALLVLAGCGGGSSSSAPPLSMAAVTINLYPSQSAAAGSRLFVFVTAVGETPVNMPLAFDTGSAGITLYAPDIFPQSLVTSAGFVFPSGAASLSYGGITVLDQQGRRAYGSATQGRTQVGNIGYATVTFGDSAGVLTTALMPVFLYYQILDDATGASVPVPPERGWFGVHDGAGFIDEGTAQPADGYPACAPDTLGSCYVASVLKYLDYGGSLHAGFLVRPAALQACDITAPGSCRPAPLLTVGLTSASEAMFAMTPLTCPQPGYPGPRLIAGFAVCQAGIADALITVGGTDPGVLSGDSVLFDTGTPYMILNVPAGNVFPVAVPENAPVTVATPAGFDYTFSAGPPYGGGAPTPESVSVVLDAATTRSVVGVGFFTGHAFLIDFTTHTEGWQ